MDYGWILISHDTYESPFMASNLGSSMFHILPYPIGLPPKRTSPPPLWRPCQTSVLFAWERVNLPPLSRKIRSEWSEWLYSYITYIYIYLVGGWPTPLENIMHENDLIIFTAVKMLLLLSELVSIQRSDDLHIPWSSLTSLMRGLWWSGHFLLLPRITELPIMTQDQSTCRIFSPLTDPPETAPKLCEL